MHMPEILKDSITTNIHEIENVAPPEELTLSQVVRWVCFGFIPLPKDIEIKWQHLPIFNYKILDEELKDDSIRLRLFEIFSYLENGKIKSTGTAPDGAKIELKQDFWKQDFTVCEWHTNSAEFGAGLIPLCEEDDPLFKSLYQEYGRRVYSDITVPTEQVASVFDLRKDLEQRTYAPSTSKPSDDAIFWINFSPYTREITLNDDHLIHTPHDDSRPCIFFKYVYDNTNRKISYDEIRDYMRENDAGDPPNFKSMITTLKFVGKRRGLFFDTTQKNVTFYNPITEARAKAQGINSIEDLI